MKFSTRKRKVCYFVDEICIDGHWFGLDDLIETLEEVESDDIFIQNQNMANALKKRKVLRTSGGRHGFAASIGPRYAKFLVRMKEYKATIEQEKHLVDLIGGEDD